MCQPQWKEQKDRGLWMILPAPLTVLAVACMSSDFCNLLINGSMVVDRCCIAGWDGVCAALILKSAWGDVGLEWSCPELHLAPMWSKCDPKEVCVYYTNYDDSGYVNANLLLCAPTIKKTNMWGYHSRSIASTRNVPLHDLLHLNVRRWRIQTPNNDLSRWYVNWES